MTEIQLSAAEELLSGLVAWGAGDANVRRLVLVGSRAGSAPPDELADIDLQVYARTSEPYTRDDAWLSEIGRVWLCVRDEYTDGDILVPTRLLLFAGGVKVDFAFYPADAVSAGIKAGLAHRVLHDKDGAAREPRAAPVSLAPRRPPSAAEFARTVEEFWFEAYHVAKYLARNEPWLVKARDWATKQRLLEMIEWHERPAPGGDPAINDPGKDIRSWVSDETWEELQCVFAGFDREESWAALLATMDLFRRIAAEVAAERGFAYPEAVDANVSALILSLRHAGPPR